MSSGMPSINPENLLFPAQGEHNIERWANTEMRRGPDFGDITRAFSALMSNPSLLARGGAFVDPMQLQQQATPGYLNARSGVAQQHMSNIGNAAQLAGSAGAARSQILGQLYPQLMAEEIGGNSSLFGTLLGGAF